MIIGVFFFGHNHVQGSHNRDQGEEKQSEKNERLLQELSSKVQFSGFFDVSVSSFRNNPNLFNLGNFELDLQKSVANNFQVAAALIFNKDGAKLAVGFIDYHLFGGPITSRGRLFIEKGLHFQVGRFDVPFGNDWQYSTALDRFTVSAPLSTEMVMNGGYNDIGFRLLGNSIFLNYTFYMLSGIEQGYALGGRIGFTPFNNPYTLQRKKSQVLEMGVSYLQDFDQAGLTEENIYAIDIDSQLGLLKIQGEYIFRKTNVEQMQLTGAHLTLFTDLGEWLKFPVTCFGSVGYFQNQPFGLEADDKLSRVTLGVHLNLFNVSVFKLEFLNYITGNDRYFGESFYAQLVIMF